LVDGNKTTVAAYLHSQHLASEDYVLDMYCLHAPQIRARHLFSS
jgi:hypothetical protein